MRAAVQGAGLDTKTYAAVVAQRTIYVILDLNNMQEEPQWRITAPSWHGHRRIRGKEEPLHCGAVIADSEEAAVAFLEQVRAANRTPATMCMPTACGKQPGTLFG